MAALELWAVLLIPVLVMSASVVVKLRPGSKRRTRTVRPEELVEVPAIWTELPGVDQNETA